MGAAGGEKIEPESAERVGGSTGLAVHCLHVVFVGSQVIHIKDKMYGLKLKSLLT